MAPWKQHYIHRRRIIKMYKNKIMYLYTDPLADAISVSLSERATASRQARQSTASETSFGMQWFRTTTLSPVRVNIIIILMVYSCMRNMVRRHACPASRKSWCDFLKWNIMRYALARIFAFVLTILLIFFFFFVLTGSHRFEYAFHMRHASTLHSSTHYKNHFYRISLFSAAFLSWRVRVRSQRTHAHDQTETILTFANFCQHFSSVCYCSLSQRLHLQPLPLLLQRLLSVVHMYLSESRLK